MKPDSSQDALQETCFLLPAFGGLQESFWRIGRAGGPGGASGAMSAWCGAGAMGPGLMKRHLFGE